MSINKRGQLTILIVIAVVLILAIGIFFLITKLQAGDEQSQLTVKGIQNNVQDCFEIRFLDAVRIVGYHGGYISVNSSDVVGHVMSYGYLNGKNVLVTKEKMEEEIAEYIEMAVPYCFGFEPREGMNLTVFKPEAEVKIDSDDVSAILDFPIAVEFEGQSVRIDKEYEHTLEIRLGMIHDLANGIVERSVEEPDSLDLSFLLNDEFFVRVIPKSDALIIYSITDNRTLADGAYTFRFLNKYSSGVPVV